MPKVINTRETIEIGKCIYCGTTEGNLSTEHITPLGLSGRLELLRASCQCCAHITSKIENTVLGSMSAARAALKTKTRISKKRKEPQPMLVEKDGKSFTKEVLLQDQWKVIRQPIFPLPVALDGRTYENGIESTSYYQMERSERAEDIAKRQGVDRVLFPEYPSEIFARLVAKVAYGYAVGECSLNAFEKVYVVPAILEQTTDIGRWVGCPDRREFPQREGIGVSVGFKIIPERDFIVRLKMFAQFDGVEYLIVIGKLKEIYAVSFEERIWHLPQNA